MRAAGTRVLLDHRVNLEDAEMAILRGHFAFVLAAPDDLDEDALRRDLDAIRDAIPLEAAAPTEVDAIAPHSPPG